MTAFIKTIYKKKLKFLSYFKCWVRYNNLGISTMRPRDFLVVGWGVQCSIFSMRPRDFLVVGWGRVAIFHFYHKTTRFSHGGAGVGDRHKNNVCRKVMVNHIPPPHHKKISWSLGGTI
jgi:hypothetical protein